MSWNDVDDKHKRKYDKHFVACDESYERQWIIDTINEHFPQYSKEKIATAVDKCCKLVPAPRYRPTFLECVKKQLA